jgi:hypothetical protein
MTTFEKDGEEDERKFQRPVPRPDGRHTAGGQAVPPQQQSAGRLCQQVPLQAGLAIRNLPKKTLKMFFWDFLNFLIFYENNTNFFLRHRFFMNK